METPITPPMELFTEDLFKPIFSAAWVGLVMASLEGLSRNKRITLFALFVLMGIAYFTHKRIVDDED